MRAITKDGTERERHDTFAALFVGLCGTLDRLNALELINQILEGFLFAGLKHLNEDLKNA
jgi:hypothetical protein